MKGGVDELKWTKNELEWVDELKMGWWVQGELRKGLKRTLKFSLVLISKIEGEENFSKFCCMVEKF